MIGRIHNLEGAKTMTLSFKTAARATMAIARHNIKNICFANVQTCILRLDATATAG